LARSVRMLAPQRKATTCVRAEDRPVPCCRGEVIFLVAPTLRDFLSRQLVSVKIADKVLLAARLKLHAWLPLRPNTGIGRISLTQVPGRPCPSLDSAAGA